MANRVALIRKADAARLLRAARESGYKRARVIVHPDGRVEVVADDVAGTDPDAADQKPNDWDEVLH
jgi:hypothetical protein